MKKSNQLLAAFCIATFSTLSSFAAEVGLLVEYIELPEKEATHLLVEGKSAVELRAEMDRQITAGKAKITDIAYLRRPVFSPLQMAEITKKKQKNKTFGRYVSARGKAESVLEFIYPTEWDPAQVPAQIEVDVTPDMDLRLPPTPTAFDARYIGNQLEFSAQHITGDQLLLDISTSLDHLVGIMKYGEGDDQVTQPNFAANRLASTATFKHREPVLIGMHSPEGRSKRILVFATPFVTAQTKLAIDKPETEQRTITIGVEMIEVSHEQVGKLITDATPNASELVKNGKAKLLGSAVLKTTPGQRAKVEPVHEFIYPTEYDPAEIVQKITRDLLESGKQLKTNAAATSFDVRNLGMSIEASADLLLTTEGDELIRVEVAPELVDLAKQTVWGKDESRTEMPLIRKLSCFTELAIKPGEETLAAILTPRVTADGKPDGQRRVLIYVWADVTR